MAVEPFQTTRRIKPSFLKETRRMLFSTSSKARSKSSLFPSEEKRQSLRSLERAISAARGGLTGQPQRIGTAIAMTDCVAVMARRSFVQAGTNVQPWKPSLTLVTGGVFAWMRNPMYLGLGLLTAGIAIMLASGWTLALMVPAALVLHHGVVLREERYLEAKFSDEYRRYRESVPRYGWQIPGTR